MYTSTLQQQCVGSPIKIKTKHLLTMDAKTEGETGSIPFPTPKSFPAEGKPL
jgi:hypothetical protein